MSPSRAAQAAAERPEIAAVKARLKAAEKARAEGIRLGRTQNMFCIDSWAAGRPEVGDISV